MKINSDKLASKSMHIVALVTASLLLAALSVHAQMKTIVAENFGGTGSALNGTTADTFDAGITAKGGSATWVANAGFLDNGAVSGSRVGAYLNLGSHIDDTRGTADGKFDLTMTISQTAGTWISLGFATQNAPGTTRDFTGTGSGAATTGIGTIVYRAQTASPAGELDMWGGPTTTGSVDGPDFNTGNRTLTVSLDLTPAAYNGSTTFGTVTWSDSVLGTLGSYSYTAARNFGSILVTDSASSSGTISALTLAQTNTGSAGTTTISFKANNTDDLNLTTSWVGGNSPYNTTNIAKWDDTVQSANTVSLGADTTWGGISISNQVGTVTINAGNTLTLGNEVVDIDMSQATADLTLNCALAPGADNIWDVANSRTLIVGGAVSGSFNLTKRGLGAAILTAANSYAGANTINRGTLTLSGSGNLGNTANNLIMGGGQLDLGGSSQTVGEVSITAAPASGQTITNGNLTGTSYAASMTDGNAIISANLANGSAGFTKSGAGTVTLLGDNTYTGTTTISGGALNIGHAHALGSTAGGTTVSNASTLKWEGGLSFAAENLTIGSGSSISPLLQNVSGDNTWTGPIETVGQGTYARISSDANLLTLANTIAGNDPATSVVLQGAGNILVSGKITGTSALFSGSTGAGTRTLNNTANDFSGNLSISGGTLKLGASEVIPDGAGKGNVVFSTNATASATFDLNGYSETINGLSSTTNGIVDNTAANTTSILTVGGNDQSSRYVGVTKNTGGTLALTKIGSGTLTLTGTNTYAGATTVSNGTLLVNGTIGSGAVNVNAGATLGGSGAIGGQVTLEAGSVLAPGVGTNAGVLTVGGLLQLNAGATVAIQLNGTNAGAYDQVATTISDVTLAQPTLALSLSYSPAAGDQFTILYSGPNSFVDGEFAALANGASLSVGGYRFQINYASGDGNDIALACLGPDLALPVIAPATVSGTNLVVSVPTVSAFNYVLQSTTNLTPTIIWNNESTNAGTGSDLILNVPIEPEKPQQFLRFWVY